MAVMKITEYPSRVLAQIGEPVTKFDAELRRLCDDMFETMYAEEGVGLAAPQVGLSLRLFVMDCDGIKLVAANPEIVAAEGEQAGDWYEREATGLAARCFQHETDHCDGTLFIHRLSPLKREMVVKRFQKMKKWE